MVVLDPRRTETAKVADEHHFVRPGTDASCCSRCCTRSSPRASRPCPAYVDGLDAVRDGGRAVHPGAGRRASPGSPADDDPPARPRLRRGRVGRGLRPDGRLDAGVRRGLPVGDPAAQHRHRQPRPARRRDVHPAGGRRRRASARSAAATTTSGAAGCAACRSSAASCPSRRWPTRSSRPATGQVRALVTVAGNPVLSTPNGARLDEALAGLDFHGRGRPLPQRDHPPRRRDPAADHGAGARPLRPGLPRCSRSATRPGSRRRSARARRARARLGDLPRARAAGCRAGSGAKRPLQHAGQPQARLRLSPTRIVDLLLRTGAPRLSVRSCAAHPDGRRPRAAAAAPARRLQTAGQADRPGPAARARRPRPAARPRRQRPDDDELLLIGRRHQRDNNSWMHNSRAADQGPAAAPAAHAPRRPRGRAASPTARVVAVASRVGKVAVEVPATDDDDAGRGVACRTATATGATAPGCATRERPGVSINDLTDPERLDVSGNAALNGVPVTVRPPPPVEAWIARPSSSPYTSPWRGGVCNVIQPRK